MNTDLVFRFLIDEFSFAVLEWNCIVTPNTHDSKRIAVLRDSVTNGKIVTEIHPSAQQNKHH